MPAQRRGPHVLDAKPKCPAFRQQRACHGLPAARRPASNCNILPHRYLEYRRPPRTPDPTDPTVLRAHTFDSPMARLAFHCQLARALSVSSEGPPELRTEPKSKTEPAVAVDAALCVVAVNPGARPEGDADARGSNELPFTRH
jgi:hypothetical protein